MLGVAADMKANNKAEKEDGNARSVVTGLV